MASQPLPEERYRYSFNRSLEAVKAAVRVIDEADLLCGPAGQRTGLRRVGDRWVGLCPLPDHDEKTPSFTVYPDDHWWCFGCDRGGDVLDLHQLAHGVGPHEKWEALVSLASARNVKLPGRTERWHEGNARKAEYRRAAYRVLGETLKRRLFRVMILPAIDAIPDPRERERELARAWDEWDRALFWPALAERLLP